MQVLQIYSPHISLFCISQEFRNQIIMNIIIINFRMYTFNTSIRKICMHLNCSKGLAFSEFS